jgi:hypothetical protein
LGRNIDVTAAQFIDRTKATKAEAKQQIKAEIRAGKVVVEREFNLGELLRARAAKVA